MQKKIKQNFIFAFTAQAISLIVSCSTNLVLPKVLSVSGYSYWQLFLFYCTYVPCLALGLNDGIYLRYGGMHRQELDKDAVKSQLGVGLLYQLFLGMIVNFTFILFSHTAQRRLLFLLVLVYYFFYTGHNFLGFVFQSINETNIYSKSIIIVRIIFFTAQVLLMLAGVQNVNTYITFYIISISLAFAYLLWMFRPELMAGRFSFQKGIAESWTSIRVGISLMFANICSLLILGVCRQIIDVRWGLIAFGKVSLSLTLMNFALTFITQISLVLFPALRRFSVDRLQQYYVKLNRGLFYILPLMYIFYLPLAFLLKLWLPKYTVSIDYLATVLPICYFDSKMNLIGNTFFKVLNKQVLLLKINVVTIILSSVMELLAAYVFNTMYFAILGMVLAIMFRNVLADILLSSSLGVNILSSEILDIILAILFILTANSLSWWQAMLGMLVLYLLRGLVMQKKTL
ncbi:hypothetical protein [Limosilactobacillus sp.]|uniref:hypothetical protein n=1 Tax=Limosilactobacillus sp. TaxID=2773925 RepID=UPI003F115A5A